MWAFLSSSCHLAFQIVLSRKYMSYPEARRKLFTDKYDLLYFQGKVLARRYLALVANILTYTLLMLSDIPINTLIVTSAQYSLHERSSLSFTSKSGVPIACHFPGLSAVWEIRSSGASI